MIRPTTGILWAPLVVYEWFYSFNKGPKHFISTFLLKTVPVCLVLATLAVAVDSYFYGKLTIVPWNFFIFNIAENVSSQYGTNHLLWYFYNAFPTIFGPLGIKAKKLLLTPKSPKNDNFLRFDLHTHWTMEVFKTNTRTSQNLCLLYRIVFDNFVTC